MTATSFHAPAAPTNRLLTAELFREVTTTESQQDLVAVGLTLHHFTEVVRDLILIPSVDLHRATTIMTRQAGDALATDDALEAIRRLTTDPDRIATADGQTAAEFCGRAWPRLQATAADRAASALEGARSFGEPTVLHLAATRAVRPQCVWWGTDGWSKRLSDWFAETQPSPRLRATAIASPEFLPDDILAELIDA